MERVCFLIEATGERLGCLLNPESVVVRRQAGLRARRSAGGLLTGTRLADDPLLATGGGRTELELDLLFDVTLAGSSITSENVQDLTRPLWQLAENVVGPDGYGAPRQVRFVWGKAWNVPVVVAAIAERFERFTTTGVPERSWLRMRLLRVGEAVVGPTTTQEPGEPGPPPDTTLPEVPDDQLTYHEVVAGGGDAAGERLDDIAARYYGEPGLWRVLAAFNGIADPLRIPPPPVIRIPPLSAIRATT
ncbi:MAG TPA: hypothetical protein VGQ47_01590 [Candidatus Limnocylindrales bacterium]|jgi:hypothetical protein|nr:hypothetical protein [Candidatus Limnocylindrales bacterium]